MAGLKKADVETIFDSALHHNDTLKKVAAQASDPSVTVIKKKDGTATTLVVCRGKFREISDVTFVDLTIPSESKP